MGADNDVKQIDRINVFYFSIRHRRKNSLFSRGSLRSHIHNRNPEYYVSNTFPLFKPERIHWELTIKIVRICPSLINMFTRI